MLEVTNYCAIQRVLKSDHTKYNRMEINTDFFPNQDFLIGKRIGDTFKNCELSKSCKDVELEYEIIDIQTYSEREKAIQQLVLTLRVDYDFTGFIHTTELENFKSIVKTGKLIPRNALLNNEVNFIDRAWHDVLNGTNDYVKNCCRFYYAHNTPTNYRAGYENRVSMVFDETLAYNPNAQFANKNAYFGEYSSNISKVIKYDWEGIFERGSYKLSKYQKALEEKYQSEYVDASNLITAVRNAEFLIYGEVPISFIKKIFVYNEDVYKEMRKICDDDLFKKVELKGVENYVKIF